jgi:beta-glucanase (GH16 family)
MNRTVRRSAPAIRRPAVLAAVLAALAALAAAGCAAAPAAEGGSNWNNAGWKLAWADEFDGPALAAHWTAEQGNGANGWGNREKEYYTGRPENLAIVADGAASVLRIRAQREDYMGRQYTSARIKTQGGFSFRYGRLEARIKLPAGQGLWPAFWTLGDAIAQTPWPACGEIDILEMRGGIADNAVSGTIHYRDAKSYHSYPQPGLAVLASGVFADAYHLFGIEWSDKELTWYLDGKAFFKQPLTQEDRNEFRDGKQFILLNLAVGGNFLEGRLPPETFASADMLVDWVRLYQR